MFARPDSERGNAIVWRRRGLLVGNNGGTPIAVMLRVRIS